MTIQRCAVCSILDRCLFGNPYYHSGSVIAKLACNWATAVWATIIIVRPYSIGTSAYSQLSYVLQNRGVALALLLLSIAQSLWLILRLRPHRYGSAGYAMQCGFWLTLLILICMADGPIRAAPISAVSTVVILCAAAYVTSPKSGWRDGIAD